MAGRLARSDSRESVFSNASCVSGVGEWQIGDRVKLDNKIGTLAYVGHTKFAPGEWIGLVLDTPDGKNNGSVQGVAYFTCDDNHGIFCKSSKLERISHSPAVGSPMRELNNKYASEFGLDIGDRVMVSGGKIGYLRYLGPTDFAEGIWCGVELDQPMGKNDGTVQGKRYFACKPLYGLFAPAKKTEKAPKLDTPSKIRVHHNKTSMLRAHKSGGSHESLNSIGASSVSSRMTTGTGIGPVKRSVARSINASTNETLVKALQETIQEKDRHLEQMIHELDLERNEIVEVTARCEILERRLASGEGTESGSIDDDKIRRIEKLENERKTLKNSLIEKEKIIEDLQFRLEEEEIMRQEKESESKELGVKLAKISTVEAINTFDSVSMEEKNSELAIVREDLEKMKGSRDRLEEANNRSEKMITDMRTTLEETEERMKKLEKDLDKVMSELEEESVKNASATKELSEEKKKGEVIANERISMEKENEESRKEIEALKNTMESIKTATCASCVKLESGREELMKKVERMEQEMKNERDKLVKERDELDNLFTIEKNKLEEKDKEMTILSHSMNASGTKWKDIEKELIIEKKSKDELNVELEKVQSSFCALNDELSESKSINEKTKDELEKIRIALSESGNEVLNEKMNVDKLKMEIDKLQKEINEKSNEIKSLSDGMTNLRTKNEGEGKENEEMKRSVEELKRTIEKEAEEKRCLMETIQDKMASLSEMETTIESLKSFLEKKKIDIDRISLESAERKNMIDELLIEKRKLAANVDVISGERDEGVKLLKEAEIKLAGTVEKSDEVRKKLENELESILGKMTATEEKLDVKETEIKCVQESLNAIQSSMEVAKMGDDEKSKELNGVKEELGKERTTSHEMKRRNDKLNTEINELKTRLEEMKTEKKMEEDKIEKEREELKSEIKKMEGEWKISKKRGEMEKGEKEKVKEEKKTIEEDLKRVTMRMEEVENEKERVEKRLKEIENEMKKLNDELNKTKEEGGKNEIESSEWRRKYEDLDAQAMKSNKLIGEMEKRENDLKASIERLRVEVNEKESESQANEDKSIELSNLIDVMNRKVEELNDNVKKMESEIKNEREEKEEIKMEKNKWKIDKENGDEKMESILEEMKQLRITIGAGDEQSIKMGEKISILMEEKSKSEDTREMMEKEKEMLVDNIKKMEIELEQLRVTISTSSSSSDELIERLKSTVEENIKMDEEIERVKQERKDFEEKIDRELEKLREEKEKANSKNSVLEESLTKNEEDMKKIKTDFENEATKWKEEMDRLKEDLSKKEDIVKESATKLNLLESEMSAEKKEKRKLEAEMRLNAGDLQEKSEESFKKDTQIENMKYEKTQIMNELEKEKKERAEMEVKINKMEIEWKRSTSKDSIEGLRVELDGERKKYDELLAQKKQTHELFDELEKSWRKKEENLAEKVDGLTAELEMIKRKTANEQMRELQNEVDLLRSIVAERVKKEEKYKNEIEILKNMPLDSTPVRKEKKEIAPRKFCDICDVFDTHETEDCPTQSMEPIDPSPKKTKVIPASREYCDSCEVFGHDTSGCPNLFASDETPKKKKDYTF